MGEVRWEGGRGKGWPFTECVVAEVCSRMKAGVIQAYVVRVKIERERWVFISAYGTDRERSEEEIVKF